MNPLLQVPPARRGNQTCAVPLAKRGEPYGGGYWRTLLREWCNTDRRNKVHKKRQMTTPSLRFPLPAGGTEPLRGSPREAGGTLRRGVLANPAARVV